MAKKKLTHQCRFNDHKQEHEEAPQHSQHPTPPPITVEDDPSTKLQSLKNLNFVLLKETAERRQQLQSLVETKEALQSALNRSAMEEKLLQIRLSESAEDNFVLELEKGVFFIFVETQMRELGFRFDGLVGERNEMKRVVTERESKIAVFKEEVNKLKPTLENQRVQLSLMSRERDQMKCDFDGVVAEAERLREKLVQTESIERKLREEVEKLSLESEKLMEEGYEKERVIGELRKEKELALRSSEESTEVIEKLREEYDRIVRKKNEIEKLKNAQEIKITGLELELKELEESMKNLSGEEALMRAKILELEGSLSLAMEKEKEMAMEIRALLKDKEEMEQNIEMLTERRESIQRVLNIAQKELEDKQRKIDETSRVQNEIEKVKVTRETEIVELQSEVDQLRSAVDKFKESCCEFEEKNKLLLSEVNHYRDSVEEVKLERDDIRKGFDEEKNKGENLMLQVAGMEDKVQQTEAELGQMRNEQQKLIERNKMMDSNMVTLMNEKDVLQRNLLEAQRESHDLRAKIEFSRINSNQALSLLKNTAALVCQSKESVEEGLSNGMKLEEEIQPYAEELDAIRNAFRNKNKMVDDMKQQLVLLENSVAEAHKSKGLLTLISSTTTIFAAALAAYVARGR